MDRWKIALAALLVVFAMRAPAHAVPYLSADAYAVLDPGGLEQTIILRAQADAAGLAAVLVVLNVDSARVEITSVSAGSDFELTRDPIGSPGELSFDALFLEQNMYGLLDVGSITLRALAGATPGVAVTVSSLSTFVTGDFDEFGANEEALAEVSAIPEPTTLGLALAGIGAIALARVRRGRA